MSSLYGSFLTPVYCHLLGYCIVICVMYTLYLYLYTLCIPIDR